MTKTNPFIGMLNPWTNEDQAEKEMKGTLFNR
jgi:hypothetical protein